MHLIINQVDVFFNQKTDYPPNNAYAYRSYIKTLINYGYAAKKSHLTSALWYTGFLVSLNMNIAKANISDDQAHHFGGANMKIATATVCEVPGAQVAPYERRPLEFYTNL